MNMNGSENTLRKANERGKANLGWLDTRYSFSFSDYYDPDFMGFGVLRVINEDVIAPSKGFGTHPHDNMEILTYMIEGAIEHKDTMGNHSKVQKGEIQLMSAGTGIKHSEYNPSSEEKNHLLQIWIYPEKKGLEPGYQQKNFSNHTQGLQLVASPNGEEHSLVIHQDAKIYLGKFLKSESLQMAIEPSRKVWVQMIRGTAEFNQSSLSPGDGLGIVGQSQVSIHAHPNSEFLLFDLK